MRINAFTLPEVVISAGILSLVIGFVVILHSLSGRAMGRMGWHSNANQQGNIATRRIIQAFEKSSVPTLVSESETRISANTIHSVIAPNSASLVSSVTTQVIFSLPQSTSCILPSPGSIVWFELLLVPNSRGSSDIAVRESVVSYNDGNFDIISNPSNGIINTILEDVEAVTMKIESNRVLRITIKAAYPKDRNVSQTFSIDGKSNIPVIIN